MAVRVDAWADRCSMYGCIHAWISGWSCGRTGVCVCV